MVNEAHCKILAHNLCCLISRTVRTQYELGIETEFWSWWRRRTKTRPTRKRRSATKRPSLNWNGS